MFSYIFIILLLLAGAALAVVFNKLTIPAALCGCIIGFCVYLGANWSGIIFMAVFFLLGTLATSWKRNAKEKMGIAEERRGKRNASQVLANAGLAGLLGLSVFLNVNVQHSLLIAAVFSSATADTLSSELGSVYGRNFYNILSWKKDQRGLDGVISAEGTLIGIAGSAIIAGLFSLFYGCSYKVLIILIAGTIGNLFDSILGAAFERQGHLKNDSVNFLNTVIATITAYVLYILW